MRSSDEFGILAQKLDLIATLLAAQIGPELPISERAPLLSRLGLDRHQIALVCNTRPEIVSVRLAEAKRRRQNQVLGRRGRHNDE